MKDSSTVAERPGEAGFTLIEALTAMVILLFGIAAVANLMVIAGSSNTAANHGTAATTIATQQMELLKAAPFNTLVPGGSITGDVGPPGACGGAPVTATYQCDAQVAGVGLVHVRWEIAALPAAPNTRFVQMVAESVSPLVRRRTRAWFTTFRTL